MEAKLALDFSTATVVNVEVVAWVPLVIAFEESALVVATEDVNGAVDVVIAEVVVLIAEDVTEFVVGAADVTWDVVRDRSCTTTAFVAKNIALNWSPGMRARGDIEEKLDPATSDAKLKTVKLRDPVWFTATRSAPEIFKLPAVLICPLPEE